MRSENCVEMKFHRILQIDAAAMDTDAVDCSWLTVQSTLRLQP